MRIPDPASETSPNSNRQQDRDAAAARAGRNTEFRRSHGAIAANQLASTRKLLRLRIHGTGKPDILRAVKGVAAVLSSCPRDRYNVTGGKRTFPGFTEETFLKELTKSGTNVSTPQSQAIIKKVLAWVKPCARPMSNAKLGKLVGITTVERDRCEAWAMTAIDYDEAAEREKTLAEDAARSEAARIADGCLSRDAWLRKNNSPWKALGIKKWTYYRLEKARREAVGEETKPQRQAREKTERAAARAAKAERREACAEWYASLPMVELTHPNMQLVRPTEAEPYPLCATGPSAAHKEEWELADIPVNSIRTASETLHEGTTLTAEHHHQTAAVGLEVETVEHSSSRTTAELTEDSNEKDGILAERHQPDGETEIIEPIPSRPLEPVMKEQRMCAREARPEWFTDTAKVEQAIEKACGKADIAGNKSPNMIEFDPKTGRWSPVRMRR